MGACERSKSVKRVIYTGLIMSASPRKEDDFSFKNLMDESCWTPLNCAFAHAQKWEQDYISTKTSMEKEFLAYNTKGEKRRIKVVSLVYGLVGGNGIIEYVPGSIYVIISPWSGQRLPYKQVKLLQEMLGSVSLVHIDDVCEAHIFCIENDIISERFMCVNQWPVMQEIVDYYELKFLNAQLLKEVEGDKSGTPCNSTKLCDLGFKYKYNMEQILNGSVEYTRRVGGLIDI